MTEATILAMESGPETNELIAVGVMEWEWHRSPELNPQGERVYWLIAPGGRIPEHWGKGTRRDGVQDEAEDLHISASVPGFSEDIAAAWEVFENNHGHSAWLQRMSQTTGPSDCSRQMNNALCRMDYYRAKFGKYGPWAVARTAPLAICRAALLTVLGSKKVTA